MSLNLWLGGVLVVAELAVVAARVDLVLAEHVTAAVAA
jgi:hypothetical protein